MIRQWGPFMFDVRLEMFLIGYIRGHNPMIFIGPAAISYRSRRKNDALYESWKDEAA